MTDPVKVIITGDVESLKKAANDGGQALAEFGRIGEETAKQAANRRARTMRELEDEVAAYRKRTDAAVTASAREADARAKAQPTAQDLAKAAQFVASIREQADTMGMTRVQLAAYRADQLQLTDAQRAQVVESLKSISVFDAQTEATKKHGVEMDALAARYKGYGIAASVALGGIAAGFALQVRHAIDAEAAMATLSAKTDIEVGVLGQLKYAADLSETSLTTLAKGLQNVSRLIVQAQRDRRSQAAQDFGLLGIDPAEIKSQEDALFKLADGISKLPSAYSQAGMAQKFFKGSGEELLPFLQQGSAGIRQLMAEGKEFAKQTPESTRAAKDLKDEFVRLQYAQGELAKDVAKDLVPKLTEVTKAVTLAYKEGGALYAMWIALGGAAQTALNAGEIRDLERLRAINVQRLEEARAKVDPKRPNPVLSDSITSMEEGLRRIDAQLGILRPASAAPQGGASGAGTAGAAGTRTSGVIDPIDVDAWRKFNERYLSKGDQMKRELAEAEQLAKAAGTLGSSDYSAVVAQIRKKYAEKSEGGIDWIATLEREASKKEGPYTKVEEITDKLDEPGKKYSDEARDRALAAAKRLDMRAREKKDITSYMAGVEEQERVMAEVQAAEAARQSAASAARTRYDDLTKRATAENILDPQERARAQLQLERETEQERIRLMNLTTDERKRIQQSFDDWMVQREKQLTEQLKPQWQRMVEAWDDTNRLMRDSHDTMVSAAVRAGEDMAVSFRKTGTLSASNMVDAFVDEFVRNMYRRTIGKQVASFSDMLASSILGLGSSSKSSTPFIETGIYGGADVGGIGAVPYHTGGIAGAGAGIPRFIHPAYFENAPRYHSGGLASNEIPAVLERGEEVLTRGDPRHRWNLGGSGSSIKVEIVNQSGRPMQVTRAAPQIDARGAVVKVWLDDLRNNGPMAQALDRRAQGGF